MGIGRLFRDGTSWPTLASIQLPNFLPAIWPWSASKIEARVLLEDFQLDSKSCDLQLRAIPTTDDLGSASQREKGRAETEPEPEPAAASEGRGHPQAKEPLRA